jgi:hypothetical protein
MVFGGEEGHQHVPTAFSFSPQPTPADALAVIKTRQFADLPQAFKSGIPHWPGFPGDERETIVIHTATGRHLRELEAVFGDVTHSTSENELGTVVKGDDRL